MVWSHNDHWMLTADHGGFVKYWQSNMNNVKMYQAHKDPIRGLRCVKDGKVQQHLSQLLVFTSQQQYVYIVCIQWCLGSQSFKIDIFEKYHIKCYVYKSSLKFRCFPKLILNSLDKFYLNLIHNVSFWKVILTKELAIIFVSYALLVIYSLDYKLHVYACILRNKLFFNKIDTNMQEIKSSNKVEIMTLMSIIDKMQGIRRYMMEEIILEIIVIISIIAFSNFQLLYNDIASYKIGLGPEFFYK